MKMAARVKVGRKYAVYLPRALVRRLGIREGDTLYIFVQGDSLVIRREVDFYEASLKARKRLRLSPEEVEEASREMQEELLGV